MRPFSYVRSRNCRRSRQTRKRSPAPGCKLTIEHLEDRHLLATGLGLVAGLTDSPSALLTTGFYYDLLGRAPVAGEVQGWVSALQSGVTPLQEALAFVSSPEYQANLITDDYWNLLKRGPSSLEVNGWLQTITAGADEQQVEAAFLSSAEYYQGHGNNPTNWLTSLYQNVLDRTPSGAELASWRQVLGNGVSNAQVATAFVTSAEAHSLDVTSAYVQILGRNPDPAGLASWVGAMNQGLTPSLVRAYFAASSEYAADQTLTPEARVALNSGSNPGLHFHFGPDNSPAALGYTKVPVVNYTPGRGYGWSGIAGIGARDRNTADALTTHFETGRDGTFLVDLPDGTYTVTVSLGDAKEEHDDISVWGNGSLLASGLTTAAGQFIHPGYTVQVTGGQLALRVAGAGGINPTFALDALDVTPASAAGVAIRPTTLPSAQVNSAYLATLDATGGSGLYAFAVTSGSLPSWLSLNANTRVLSGTPTAAGTYTFMITATDSRDANRTGSETYTLTVNPAPSLTVSAGPLPSATANSFYSATVSAAGGSGSYTYAVTSGSLPAGLSLNAVTGELSGTPTLSATSTFTITASDQETAGLTGSQTYTLAVNLLGSLTLNQSTLPSAIVNSGYNAQLGATGGSGTYTFAVTSGSLPSGVSLDAGTGLLSGTPTTSGTSTFTITATDSHTSGLTASQTYTLIVNPVSTMRTFPNNLNPPLLPGPTGTIINVSTVSQLQNAVANLQSGQTILIAPGTYNLGHTLVVPQGLQNIAIRGATAKASDVVIKGDAVFDTSAPYTGSAIWGAGSGISGSILFGIWLGNVQGVTIADLTLQDYVEHAIIMNAGVQSPLVHNVVMIDVGEQFVKVNPNPAGGGVDNGVVEYCTMEFTTSAPNNYTNGVDLVTAHNWVIRNNLFKNIYTTNPRATTGGPSSRTGPAVLVWQGSGNVQTLNNTFINCQTEIAYGLVAGATFDNTGGLIANNFIYRSGTIAFSDVGISVRNSPNTEVANNTIIIHGGYPNAIEYRFTSTTGVKIVNNLTDAAITQRDGATATLSNNVTNAQASWFVNESIGDLDLTAAATGAIGHGVYLPEVPTDYNGKPRPSSGPTNVGAA